MNESERFESFQEAFLNGRVSAAPVIIQSELEKVAEEFGLYIRQKKQRQAEQIKALRNHLRRGVKG